MRRVILYLVMSLCLTPPVRAGDSVVIADFSGDAGAAAPKGWQVKEKSGKADLAVIRDDGLFALRLRSADTSFSVQKEVAVDLAQYPVLSWKWKVAKIPQGGDFRKTRTDDQAAQLFLAFTKTKAIVYLWDTSAPQGLMQDAPAPPFMTIKAVVMRSGAADLGKWLTESRNIREDYRKLYGEEPPKVAGVRLQINSQHTGSSAESFFADVEFRKQ